MSTNFNVDVTIPRRSPDRSNPYGYRGVSFVAANGRYKASINACGVKEYLGSYATVEEAARAYDTAARRLHGRKAALNFPEDGGECMATVAMEARDGAVNGQVHGQVNGFGHEAEPDAALPPPGSPSGAPPPGDWRKAVRALETVCGALEDLDFEQIVWVLRGAGDVFGTTCIMGRK